MFGVLRETLRTITQFITTIVVTDIANIKYLQSKIHEAHQNCFRSGVVGQKSESVHMNVLANKWHCLRSLRNFLGDKEEEHSLAQKSGDRHGALLTARCQNQISIQLVLVGFCADEDRY